MNRLPKWILVVLALALLFGLAVSVQAAEEAKGKIKNVTPDKKEFVLTDTNAKDWTFTLAEDGKIRLGDKELKLDELKPGDEVTVTYEKKDDKFMAKEIKCERK